MYKNYTVSYTSASLLMNEIKRIEQLNDVDACLGQLTLNAFRLEFNVIDMRKTS
ncbi:MAG: hypothetical protein PUE92_01525 [Catenibacterium mitsuokai]|nr:hypothetical protein [Catenibacterium mitsuokai]MDD6594717.1 hypothetical protein [Catenibacterium mitsuokai]